MDIQETKIELVCRYYTTPPAANKLGKNVHKIERQLFIDGELKVSELAAGIPIAHRYGVLYELEYIINDLTHTQFAEPKSLLNSNSKNCCNRCANVNQSFSRSRIGFFQQIHRKEKNLLTQVKVSCI